MAKGTWLCRGSVGLWICTVGRQLCAVVSVGEEQRELVKTGCPKSVQEIWPCFVRLEG